MWERLLRFHSSDWLRAKRSDVRLCGSQGSGGPTAACHLTHGNSRSGGSVRPAEEGQAMDQHPAGPLRPLPRTPAAHGGFGPGPDSGTRVAALPAGGSRECSTPGRPTRTVGCTALSPVYLLGLPAPHPRPVCLLQACSAARSGPRTGGSWPPCKMPRKSPEPAETKGGSANERSCLLREAGLEEGAERGDSTTRGENNDRGPAVLCFKRDRKQRRLSASSHGAAFAVPAG